MSDTNMDEAVKALRDMAAGDFVDSRRRLKMAKTLLPKVEALAKREAVPEGFVLVPVEPTPKMVDATWDHDIDKNGGVESQNKRNRRIWSAMLAAAKAQEEWK